MWAWLFACAEEPGRGVQDGEPVACLAVPPGAELPADGLVEGTASADSADLEADWTWGDRCDERSRVLEIQGDDGPWRLGYGWKESGQDSTLAIDVGPGSPLTVEFFHADNGFASGFVVKEVGRIVAALEVGLGSPALPADLVPGLTVREGRFVGRSNEDCGKTASRAMVFQATTELELEPVDQDYLEVDGQQLQAWALADYSIQNTTCPINGATSWALWRTGP